MFGYLRRLLWKDATMWARVGSIVWGIMTGPGVAGVMAGAGASPPIILLVSTLSFVASIAILISVRAASDGYRLWKSAQPALTISDPIAYTEPRRAGAGKATRTYMVIVTNGGGSVVENCCVKVGEMINKDGDHSREEGRAFKRKLENTSDVLNVSHTERFNISGRDCERIDIARFDETKPGSKIEMLYALQGPQDLQVTTGLPLARCPHVLTIKAVADNIETPTEKRVKFWVDEAGTFQMVSC